MSASGPAVSCLGTSALLFEAPGETTLENQQRIWALARRAEAWPGVREAVPGVNNLLVTFAAPPRCIDPLAAWLRETWGEAVATPLGGRVIELPVVYGGEGGPHMGDVVTHTGLSVEEIVAIHSAPTYPVYALGSHPGYCYLGGMDPRIATPRRKVPVISIPGGAVSIGGSQTGVSASDGPSGWNTIGTTEMCFFDATRDPPALLRPGDSIVFRVREIRR
jgi:KipI family sensor histidine kinase inhibitor